MGSDLIMSRVLGVAIVFGILSTAFGQEDNVEEYDGQDIEEDSLNGDQLRRMHAKFDMNNDGKVSLQEVMAFSDSVGKSIASKDIVAILEEIDTNKDSFLSLEEHLNDIHNQADGGDAEEMKEVEHRKGVEAAKFKAADVNGDGKLDKSELPSLFYPETHEGVLTVIVEEAMRQKDTNKDGKLTATEFWQSDQMDVDSFDLTEEEKGDFVKLDINGDGFIDTQELRAWESGRFHTEDAMRKLVEAADQDQDLHITSDELAQARDALENSDARYHLIQWAEHHEL
jgi:Ca2+-binding EF-hand superfamily protein